MTSLASPISPSSPSSLPVPAQAADVYRQYPPAPVDFCSRVLRLEPTRQQADFLTALARPGARVAVKSGHGVGKSTVFAMAALWFLCTRHDGVVPCTAPTAHQLRDVLWREVRKCAGRMSRWWREQIVVLDDTVRLSGSAARILARTARREQPDALQGFHERHLLFLIDEAAGVADAVFEVARGALSTPNARVAMAGNPTKLTGYFHAAFHAARDNWERLTFSCLDSPLVSPAYPAEIAAEYGPDSDVYRTRVLGEFPLSGPMAAIPLELVEAAMARTLPASFNNPAAKILGVDLALEGEDRTVIALRQGVQARIVFSGRLHQTSQLLARIAQAIDAERPDAVFADKGGMGAPIIHSLNDLGRKVIGINFGDPALDKDRFVRKREEMWWLMREWLERDDPAVEPHNELRDDLIGPEYGRTAADKIQLETKEEMRKRGLASPDHGDALALTFALPVRPRLAEARARPAKPYDRFAKWRR